MEQINYRHDPLNGLVAVGWPEVNRACRARLGHDYHGTQSDARAVRQVLLNAGAPRWVSVAESFVDAHGWVFLEPLHGRPARGLPRRHA